MYFRRDTPGGSTSPLASSPVERPPRPPSGGKLRIGYVSAFFDKPNWMKPVYGVINRHDRDRFEVHLVSLGGDPSAVGRLQGTRPRCDLAGGLV